MSWFSKLSKKLKMPSKLNSIQDVMEQSEQLAELINAAIAVVKNPMDLAAINKLRKVLEALGVL